MQPAIRNGEDDLAEILQRPGMPVVAVLRFAHDGDAGDDALTDGIVEDVIRGLSCRRVAAVLSHNSSFAFASEGRIDLPDVADRLGADYLLEGVVRLDGARAVIFASLYSRAENATLWEEHYSVYAAEIFCAQADIVRQVATRISTEPAGTAGEGAGKAPSERFDAYLTVLRGIAQLRTGTDAGRERARTMFATAVIKDTGFGLAYSCLSIAKLALAGFAAASPTAVAESAELAAHGLSLAPDDPRCERILGNVRLYEREHAAAERSMRRSMALNPSDAETIAQTGFLLTLRGRPDEALRWLDAAVRLNPLHPDWYHYDRALAFYAIGQYRAAAASLSRLPTVEPGAITRLAACHAQLGELDIASEHMALLRQRYPRFSPLNYVGKSLAFEQVADAEHLSAGVMKALSIAA